MRNITVTIGAIALLAGCGVSTQQEVQMGQDEAQQVNAQLPMVQDAQIQNYVNALGNRIART
ncbi:MAG TPA: peptidase M48 Ste24p, partial [Gemmatimonadetes bacterium]|nr:peptidase M48 Ste24p [Gemmatimonadota bacterium]